MKTLVLALTAASLIAGGAAPSFAAAPCRDKNGKFVKCPKPAVAKPAKCRDAKGHYAKCK